MHGGPGAAVVGHEDHTGSLPYVLLLLAVPLSVLGTVVGSRLLDRMTDDRIEAWDLGADGAWRRRSGDGLVDVQRELAALRTAAP